MSYSLQGVAGWVSGHDDKDAEDNPAGGYSGGVGYHIQWQDGPVNRDAGDVPNGAFIEDVLLSCIARLRFYQGEKYDPADEYMTPQSDGRFACEENTHALLYLTQAHYWMMERRRDRVERGVLGKHAV